MPWDDDTEIENPPPADGMCQWHCGRPYTHFCDGCGKWICSHPWCLARSGALALGFPVRGA
jgi:hypothetical protein